MYQTLKIKPKTDFGTAKITSALKSPNKNVESGIGVKIVVFAFLVTIHSPVPFTKNSTFTTFRSHG